MATVIGMVAIILAAIAVATSTILTGVMQENLRSQIFTNAPTARITPSTTATDVLNAGRQEPGYLLILDNLVSGTTGAAVSSAGEIETLTSAQVQSVVDQVQTGGSDTIHIDGLGEYRVVVGHDPSGVNAVYGLPTSEVTATLAQIPTTIGVATIGGLLILGVLLAIIIRRSLAPLRAVAATAQRVATQPLSEGAVTIAERVPASESDAHTEIGRVGAALNTLLDHVDTALDARQRNEERMRRFVADASHELRTPLASIRGYSELSLRAIRQDERRRDASAAPEPGDGSDVAEQTESALERIQAQSLRMTALVEDLLLLARLEEGQELVYGAVDLSRLAIESLGDAQVAGPDHRWELDLSEEPVVIAGDEPRLHQVFANLLANARTHTPEGTTVTLSVAREGTEAVVRVHDTGPGVDPVIADELFERFSRADRSRARKTGGTGLGLSIVRAIVDAHGGTISVQSEPGDTTFTVRLPAKPDDPGNGSQRVP